MRLCGGIAIVGLVACGRIGFDGREPDASASCPHLFCDDFAMPSFARWGGSLTAGASTVTRDASFGRAGASLHAVGATGSSVAAEFVDVFPAVLPADEHVRVNLYSPSHGVLDCEPVELANAGRDHQIVFSLYADSLDVHGHNIAGNFEVTRSIRPPRDRWVCYELHVQIGAAGSVELFQDGVMVATKSGIDTRPSSGSLSRVHVGVASKSDAPSEELWIDDVAVDTAAIGCDAP